MEWRVVAGYGESSRNYFKVRKEWRVVPGLRRVQQKSLQGKEGVEGSGWFTESSRNYFKVRKEWRVVAGYGESSKNHFKARKEFCKIRNPPELLFYGIMNTLVVL